MGLEAWCDGACNNTIGVMGCGAFAVFDGRRVFESSFSPQFLGSSNVAEWLALVDLLKYLSTSPYRDELITVYLDSMLVVQQFRGQWGFKLKHLEVINREAQRYAKGLRLTAI